METLSHIPGPLVTRPSVLVFGELLWDIFPDGTRVLGGAPANFAFRLNELGTPSKLISKVGLDELGREALSELGKLGMDVSFVLQSQKLLTGIAKVCLDEYSNLQYILEPARAYDRIKVTDEMLKAAAQAPLIYYGIVGQRSDESRRSLSRLLEAAPQAIRFLDLNLRESAPNFRSIERALRQAHILKINDDEARFLGTAFSLVEPNEQNLMPFMESLLKRFSELNTCVITLGANGVVAQSRSGEQVFLPAYHPGSIVDMVGAGDSFSAGFVDAYLRGESLERCCDIGNLCGSFALEKCGGLSPLSDADRMSMNIRRNTAASRVDGLDWLQGDPTQERREREVGPNNPRPPRAVDLSP